MRHVEQLGAKLAERAVSDKHENAPDARLIVVEAMIGTLGLLLNLWLWLS